MDPDNSVTSTLRINAVEVPGTGGLIGMAECPAKMNTLDSAYL